MRHSQSASQGSGSGPWEEADLDRALAEQATALGNHTLAAHLEEARAEAHHMGQILGILGGIGADAADAVSNS